MFLSREHQRIESDNSRELHRRAACFTFLSKALEASRSGTGGGIEVSVGSIGRGGGGMDG